MNEGDASYIGDQISHRIKDVEIIEGLGAQQMYVDKWIAVLEGALVGTADSAEAILAEIEQKGVDLRTVALRNFSKDFF